MEFEQIKELIKLLQETNIGEFKYESADLSFSIRSKDYQKTKEVMMQPTMMQGAPQMAMQYPGTIPNTNVAPTHNNTGTAQENKTEAPKNEGTEVNPNVKYIEIKSPMVGTFYRSASPEKPPFIKVGDTISGDSTVCLIEAMKLFNEVKAEVNGKIVKVMVEDASPVEYEQVLFLVEPL